MEVQKALLALKDEPDGEKALFLLHASSYFALDDIEIDLFAGTLGGCEKVDQAVELLKRHSLVQTAEKERCILVGTKVRKEVQNLLRQQNEEETVLQLTIQLLDKKLSIETSPILHHAMSVFEVAKGYPELLKKTSHFPTEITYRLIMLHMHLEASIFSRQALDFLQKFVGGYHYSTLRLQKCLGHALLCLKYVDESLEVFSEVYQRRLITRGERRVNETLSWIAKVMSEKTSEPESRVRRLVFGDATVSGTKNNSTLNLWCEYALMLSKLDRWTDEALSILNEVLEKRRELLDPNDDDICEVEDSIAQVHLKRYEYHQSLEVYQRVYEKRRSTLGEDCIKTQTSRKRIALAYEALEMLDEALIEYEAVAESTRKIVEDDDIIYLSTLDDIACVLNHQGKYDKSLDLYNLLHIDYARVFGAKDIRTLKIKYTIGGILSVQGKTKEAVRTWREVLQGYLQVLGPNNSETVDLMRKILVSTFSSISNIRDLMPNL